MDNNLENLIETNALIEQHIHGGFGIDFATCDKEGFIEFAQKIVKFGVCGFFPTLATDSIENIKKQLQAIKLAMELQSQMAEPMAKILGVHLEGIFLNPEKKGIHNEQQLLKPTVENYKLIEDKIIKIVTLAPELDTNFELCKYLKEKGVRVSAGHCCATDLTAVEQVTHLYNAMGTFSHKAPSTATSALADDNIYTEIIADGQHVIDEVLKITFKTKSQDKIILISDALPIAHSNLESMEFCSKIVYLKDEKATDAHGTMAGSTKFISDIIKRLVTNGFTTLETAVVMASTNINYIEKPNAKIYWDENLDIKAIKFNNKIHFI